MTPNSPPQLHFPTHFPPSLRYFITAQALLDHLKSKVHKRRLKQLEEEPYSVEESLRAAGIGSFVEPKKRLVQSQPTDEGEDYVPPAEVM